jgi:hypothetical protein
MEFLLHLWDEVDDLTGACRHLATYAVAEAAALSAPLVTAGSALGVWLLLPQFRMNAALLAGTATFWGAYRHLLRVF